MSRIFVDGVWSDKPGYYTRTPKDTLGAISWLDPANYLTKHETKYFADTIAALNAAGYDNTTLAGLPYDFRKGPDELQDTFQQLVTVVETMFSNTGKRVTILSHSMVNILS